MSKEQQTMDMFLEVLVDLPMKGERRLLEFPFFPIAKTPRRKEMIFEDPKNGVRIEVAPGHKGCATIWDKDILYYMATLVNRKIEQGEHLDPENDRIFRVNGYDLLVATGRSTGGRDYALLEQALDRLQSTSVRTSLGTGKEDVDSTRAGFSWIDKYKIVEKKVMRGGQTKKVAAAIEIHMNEWLMRALVEDRSVLTINPMYFDLRGGLERRLYELARKHCGQQTRWVIGMNRLREKCGTSQELRYFKRDLKEIIQRQPLPDYEVGLAFDRADRPLDLADKVLMRRWGSNDRILVVFSKRYAELFPNHTDKGESALEGDGELIEG